MAMYGYVGLCRAVYGYVGLCRAMYGYVGLSMAVYGYVWLCMARGWKLNNWITIIHYSLLFSPNYSLFISIFFVIFIIHFFSFCISFPLPNFLQCNFYTLFIKSLHLSIHSTLSLASTILFFL